MRTYWRSSRAVTTLLLLGLQGVWLEASIQLQVTTSVLAPQPVGTKVTLTASATESNPGPLTYKFEYAPPRSSTFSLLRDFSLLNTFDWATIASEGIYQIRVTARDFLAGETAQQTITYQLTSRVVSGQAAVTATAHPLVGLFSAPSCPVGSFLRVSYQKSGSPVTNRTSYVPCRAGASVNLYVAGMYPNTTYNMNYEVLTGTTVAAGPSILAFQTGALSRPFPTRSVPVPPGPQTAANYKYVLTGYAHPGFVATDLNGNIVWYYVPGPNGGQLTRPLAGGTMLVILDGQGTGTGPGGNGTTSVRQQILREFDLAGNVRRETNADRVSEQLVALGTDPIDDFNHEAVRLPNGFTMVLAHSQRILPAGTQGSPVPIDVVGAVIVVLDQNWQVVWFWSAFDHAGGGDQLDINRAAIRGETCAVLPTGAVPYGCPPYLLSSPAPDWLHSNSLQLLPDGNILMSIRNQDWVVKIDYAGGAGSGAILWRMGLGGDFTINSSDPSPWFSGQHEAAFEDGGLTRMSLFDNGNTRVRLQGRNSRGQVLNVDEANRTVTLDLNADLGVFASALGSAQPLSNGNWTFQPGWFVVASNPFEQSMEVTATGSVVYAFQSTAPSYRSWRLTSLYGPPGT